MRAKVILCVIVGFFAAFFFVAVTSPNEKIMGALIESIKTLAEKSE
jgi:hypothetical protein